MVERRWPPKKEIPQRFERRGFSHRLSGNLARTSIRGYARTRRRSRLKMEQIQGFMLMTAEQIKRLGKFFDSETRWGNMSFEFPNPYYEKVHPQFLRPGSPPDNGKPEFLTVAFLDAPKWVCVGYDLYKVRLNLETQP